MAVYQIHSLQNVLAYLPFILSVLNMSKLFIQAVWLLCQHQMLLGMPGEKHAAADTDRHQVGLYDT